MAKFEVYRDGEGRWRWRLRTFHGIAAVSDGSYPTLESAKNSIVSVKKTARDAEVVVAE